jgi:NAD(P)-dependent dehydrogenase (short-subunit alcohol dehydrogenase family)
VVNEISGGALKDQVIVVIGAAGGLGRAVVERAIVEGARGIVAGDPRADATADLARELSSPECEVIGVGFDATNPDSCEQTMQESWQRFGRLDGLAVASGVSTMTVLRDGQPWGRSPFIEGDNSLLDEMLHINLYVPMNMNRAFARILVANETEGAIVNVTSIAASRGDAQNAPYCASKLALRGFSRCMALELAEKRIRVNSVAPGYMESMMTAHLSDSQMAGQIPLGRMAKPAEVATAITFLLSPASSYLTGTEIVVDGGVLTRATL